MNACMSPQEEEALAYAAVARLGEASAHEVAQELGVGVIRHTLGRLVDRGRLSKQRVLRANGGLVWVFRVAHKERHAAVDAGL